LPVLRVPAGSKHKIAASSSAQVRLFHAARHDDTFSGLQNHDMIPKLNAEPAAPDHEELVLVLVMVPREFALNFHKLDLLAVQGRDDLWAPMFAERSKFFVQIDFVHFRDLVISIIFIISCIVPV
jgi:hypothetical protein